MCTFGKRNCAGGCSNNDCPEHPTNKFPKKIALEYSNRQWLNPNAHSSTGAVVAYHGESPWDKEGKPELMTILEISDCHNKVRLHRSEKDTMEEFIIKMETLQSVVQGFIHHLRDVTNA